MALSPFSKLAATFMACLLFSCSGSPPKEHRAALKQLRAAAAILGEGKPKTDDAIATDGFLSACATLGHLADGTEPGLSASERKRLGKVVVTCHRKPAESVRVAREIADD